MYYGVQTNIETIYKLSLMMRYLSRVFVGADKLFIGFQYCYVLWICDENIANKIFKILDNLEFRKKQNRINISPLTLLLF